MEALLLGFLCYPLPASRAWYNRRWGAMADAKVVHTYVQGNPVDNVLCNRSLAAIIVITLACGDQSCEWLVNVDLNAALRQGTRGSQLLCVCVWVEGRLRPGYYYN